MGPKVGLFQQQSRRRQIGRRGCETGIRLLGSALLSAVALSEALPSSPHAVVIHGVSCASGRHVSFGCREPAGREERVLIRPAFLRLRGGVFSWGAPEQQEQQERSPSRRGASGLFGAAWGGGETSNGIVNNSNDGAERRSRVDTRGPPDLNARPPPTVPGSGGSGGGGLGGVFFGGASGTAGGAGGARERVRTVGPPDAGGGGEGGGGGGGRRGRRSGFFSPPGPPTSGREELGGGRRADPFWAGAVPNLGFGGRTAVGRDDGVGDGPRRYGGAGGGGRGSSKLSRAGGRTNGGGGLMAVHYLVLSCFGLFSLNTLFGVDRLFGLSLDHQRPRWWQAVTSLLLHGDQHHLMGNMFNLVIFGKMAEEDMGSIGMLVSFVACGVASSFVSLMIMPRTINSCGASGAIFGLYSVCVLGKMFNIGKRGPSDGRLRKLIEAAVFGWFVMESVMSEMRMVVAGGVTGIDHAAHFGGVFAGAVLILMFCRSMRGKSSRE